MKREKEKNRKERTFQNTFVGLVWKIKKNEEKTRRGNENAKKILKSKNSRMKNRLGKKKDK